jgi:hypothetical protein
MEPKGPQIPPDLTVAELRSQLVDTFGEYHSSIDLQVSLVDRLIEAVRRERQEGGTNTSWRRRSPGRRSAG